MIHNEDMRKEELLLTIFTPTFNRAKSLRRTYLSLLEAVENAEIGNDVEWIVVDDGSTDGTKEIIASWIKENKINIKYFWQQNQGKHIAMNFAVKQAKGNYFLVIDSDDALLPESLSLLLQEWDKVDKNDICCISGRCVDSCGKLVGLALPYSPLDISFTDLRMKLRNNGELLDLFQTKILKEYPFPKYDKRMRFCPEAIAWFEIAKKYKMRIVDKPVRKYYYDADTSLIKTRNVSRSVATFYLWRYLVNNLSSYIYYNPKEIMKAYVGLTRDGINIGYSISKILGGVNSMIKKMVVVLFMPIGYILSKF